MAKGLLTPKSDQKLSKEIKKSTAINILVAVVLAVTGIGATVYFAKNDSSYSLNFENIQQVNDSYATSTLNITELLSKALDRDTVVERQDFLSTYIGESIHGSGVVRQVSRAGEDFYVDIRVNVGLAGQTMTCFQEGSEENEKKLIFLQDKSVNFSGVFTYQNIFEHGLEIGECELSLRQED